MDVDPIGVLPDHGGGKSVVTDGLREVGDGVRGWLQHRGGDASTRAVRLGVRQERVQRSQEADVWVTLTRSDGKNVVRVGDPSQNGDVGGQDVVHVGLLLVSRDVQEPRVGAGLQADVLVGWHNLLVHVDQVDDHGVLDLSHSGITGAGLGGRGTSKAVTEDSGKGQRLWHITLGDSDLEPVVQLLHLIAWGLQEPPPGGVLGQGQVSEDDCAGDLVLGSRRNVQRGLRLKVILDVNHDLVGSHGEGGHHAVLRGWLSQQNVVPSDRVDGMELVEDLVGVADPILGDELDVSQARGEVDRGVREGLSVGQLNKEHLTGGRVRLGADGPGSATSNARISSDLGGITLEGVVHTWQEGSSWDDEGEAVDSVGLGGQVSIPDARGHRPGEGEASPVGHSLRGILRVAEELQGLRRLENLGVSVGANANSQHLLLLDSDGDRGAHRLPLGGQGLLAGRHGKHMSSRWELVGRQGQHSASESGVAVKLGSLLVRHIRSDIPRVPRWERGVVRVEDGGLKGQDGGCGDVSASSDDGDVIGAVLDGDLDIGALLPVWGRGIRSSAHETVRLTGLQVVAWDGKVTSGHGGGKGGRQGRGIKGGLGLVSGPGEVHREKIATLVLDTSLQRRVEYKVSRHLCPARDGDLAGGLGGDGALTGDEDGRHLGVSPVHWGLHRGGLSQKVGRRDDEVVVDSVVHRVLVNVSDGLVGGKRLQGVRERNNLGSKSLHRVGEGQVTSSGSKGSRGVHGEVLADTHSGRGLDHNTWHHSGVRGLQEGSSSHSIRVAGSVENGSILDDDGIRGGRPDRKDGGIRSQDHLELRRLGESAQRPDSKLGESRSREDQATVLGGSHVSIVGVHVKGDGDGRQGGHLDRGQCWRRARRHSHCRADDGPVEVGVQGHVPEDWGGEVDRHSVGSHGHGLSKGLCVRGEGDNGGGKVDVTRGVPWNNGNGRLGSSLDSLEPSNGGLGLDHRPCLDHHVDARKHD